MKNTIRINELPTRTWNRLGVNAAEIEWDTAAVLPPQVLAVGAGEHPAPLRLDVRDTGACTEQTVTLHAAADSDACLVLTAAAAHPLALRLDAALDAGARVRVILLENPTQGATVRVETHATCAAGAKIEYLTILLGDGDLYADQRAELVGDGSALKADIAYFGRGTQTVDYNIAVNHFGRKTGSEILASGALADAAKKIFRGTIDFKRGCADSVGSENETVLMLGDDAVNKTVPLILCAEENVEGTHGATIGELDAATLFYFESRGIDRAAAQAILSRAAIERLIRMADDETFVAAAEAALEAVLGDKGGKDA